MLSMESKSCELNQREGCAGGFSPLIVSLIIDRQDDRIHSNLLKHYWHKAKGHIKLKGNRACI